MMSRKKDPTLTRLSTTFLAVGTLVLLFVGTFTLILGPHVATSAARDEVGPSQTASPTSTPSPTQDATSCEPEYTQIAVSNENGRVDNDFAAKYAAATAEANNLSEAQRDLLIEESGKSAQTLAAWAHAFGLYEDPNNREPLIDGNCLSSEGQRLHAQLDGALSANGSVFEESEAPADGFNSGINNGVYGASSAAGVTGDRKAIKVTLKNGTVVYIMVRCANPVYPGQPSLPQVPTDNPPPTTPPTDNPPENPPTTTPKDPSKDPYVQGNAPVGGGQNADPGPGTYVPPGDMVQPPSTPRENPAPPPAAPPAAPPSGGSGPAPAVPTPDPAPAPAPEPAAPAPSAPVQGCVPAPGKTTC